MLTCRDARAVIVRTIDDQSLPGDARAALRVHLAACAGCLEEYETQHEVRRLLALHIEEPLPASFAERLSARLAQESQLAPEPSLPLESSPPPESSPVIHAGVFPPANTRLSAAPHAARWRTCLRLLPIAATLALMVADAQLQKVTPPSQSAAPSSAASAPATPSSQATAAAATEPPQPDAPAPRRPIAVRRQAAKEPLPPLPSHAQLPTSMVEQRETVGEPTATAMATATVTAKRPSPVATLPIVPAPDLAEALKLSDTQLKQIDAAIERVLTPDQRRLYRERHANPEGNVADRPNASERSSIRPRPAAPVPPTQPTLQPPW